MRLEVDNHETLVAGRAGDAQLCLEKDPHFSRYHFRLEIQPPECHILDLTSRNGTLVNGDRVTKRLLRDGDLISGGKTRIRFSTVGPAAALKDEQPAISELEQDVPDTLIPSFSPTESILYSDDQEVPGYDIFEELGRGSMGVVYRAAQKATGRECAVKIITPAREATTETLQFFLREASILSQLHHPRIIRFHEMGITQGRLFLAMEYVRTESIQNILRGEPLAVRMRIVCGIGCQILEALAYAHGQSIVHRDIKPSNILLTRTGGPLQAKLADFGLAKNFLTAGFSSITQDGEVLGSVVNMPPEQILRCRYAKPACDIYAMGVLLYRFLSGRLPFNISATRNLFAVILEEAHQPLKNYVPDLPDGLVRVVHRAMDRNPLQRFESAEEMRLALLPFSQ